MKLTKILFVLVFAVLFTSCDSKTSNTNGYTTIYGTYVLPTNRDQVILSKIANGQRTKIASVSVNADNKFGFAIKPDEEGFYILGERGYDYPLYIKGDQAIEINFNLADGFEMVNPYDEENKVLSAWVTSNDPLKPFNFMSMPPKNYEEFFPFYEKFIPEMKAQHDLVNTSNPKFNELMHSYIDLNIEYTALHFLHTPRTKHPKKEELPSFYDDILNTDIFKSANILKIPNGFETLHLHQKDKYEALKKSDPYAYYPKLINTVSNDTVRGIFVLEYLKSFKNYDQNYIGFIDSYRDDIELSEYAKNEVEKFELTIKNMNPGTQGYPWSYKDVNGKEYAFSDFRGKYLYIDVWATWCAPCKKEIPALKQLEKDLHGKDIQFVSISMDKPKHEQKWKDFVKNENLTGIQLMSENAFQTRIGYDYKIKTIPRFLLFDPEGRIIDANAKRPSDPELKKQLLTLLK
ncbi:TlpA family protein disulfide reductase [Gaetbulibacter saemankumensis]|uniref:TlpA family protein disulfide reductase n=1 Tax=Gaetbulibacter saemankumensis TaxID=311208 RepID=UPI00040C6423|nr:TlpA disulfide reductase family protein [Gaetbulibacter saemankumensis]